MDVKPSYRQEEVHKEESFYDSHVLILLRLEYDLFFRVNQLGYMWLFHWFVIMFLNEIKLEYFYIFLVKLENLGVRL